MTISGPRRPRDITPWTTPPESPDRGAAAVVSPSLAAAPTPFPSPHRNRTHPRVIPDPLPSAPTVNRNQTEAPREEVIPSEQRVGQDEPNPNTNTSLHGWDRQPISQLRRRKKRVRFEGEEELSEENQPRTPPPSGRKNESIAEGSETNAKRTIDWEKIQGLFKDAEMDFPSKLLEFLPYSKFIFKNFLKMHINALILSLQKGLFVALHNKINCSFS